MNMTSPVIDEFRRTVLKPTGAIPGLVDGVLALCWKHGLELEWHPEHCTVRSAKDGSEEIVSLPLRKSVFRAVLARFGVMCNERSPNSVSLYGGKGELSVGTNPPTVFRVSFMNTPGAQMLELTNAPVTPQMANGAPATAANSSSRPIVET